MWYDSLPSIGKFLVYLSLACLIVTGIFGGANAGCAYSDRADAEARLIDAQAREKDAKTQQESPCTDQVYFVAHNTQNIKCPSTEHTLHEERGRIVCKCNDEQSKTDE